ncbi:MAG: hypothetical protein ABIL09_04615 [Gemmatimonadota bacterium]
MWSPWRGRRLDALLSAYLDGELDPPQQDEVTERLVMDGRCRRALDTYAAATRLAQQATAPRHRIDGAAAADRLMARLADGRTAGAALPPAVRRRRSRLVPALLATAGLLVTAGVTYVGLRRRGLV